jgi:hypothetical protein
MVSPIPPHKYTHHFRKVPRKPKTQIPGLPCAAMWLEMPEYYGL